MHLSPMHHPRLLSRPRPQPICPRSSAFFPRLLPRWSSRSLPDRLGCRRHARANFLIGLEILVEEVQDLSTPNGSALSGLTKLLAALTKVAKGELARQILNFKEVV